MKIYSKIAILILLVMAKQFYSQKNLILDSVRVNFCKKKCRIFLKELEDKKHNDSAIPSFMLGTPQQ